MTIFDALRADHDRQRTLLDKLEQTEGASGNRGALFAELKSELDDHAALEEKHFYSALMRVDMTIEKARHSVAEHKELDDRVEELEGLDYSNPHWLIRFKEFRHRVLHHLEEEEREVFQVAGKALGEGQKTVLGTACNNEMEERKS